MPEWRTGGVMVIYQLQPLKGFYLSEMKLWR